MEHLDSTKNRVVIIQKIIIITYLLACYIGPDRPWAVIVAGRRLGAPRGGQSGRGSVFYHHWDVWARARPHSYAFNGSHGRYNYIT